MKITKSQLKKIIKEETQSVVEDFKGIARGERPIDAEVRAEGMKNMFVKQIYWVKLLLGILDKNKKVNLRLLPKYTDEIAAAVHTIRMWNGFSEDQKRRSAVDKKEVDRAYVTVGGASPRPRQEKGYERWLIFQKGLYRALEDMQGGIYDQTLAVRAEREVLGTLNSEGYHAMLDLNKDADPHGVLAQLTKGRSPPGGWSRHFDQHKAASQAAPKWRQKLEPVRRGLKKVGLAEIIDEELEAVLAEKEDDSFSKAGEEIEKKGTEGVFTAKAKKAGMGVQAYADKVLAKGSKASTKTKRQASFAKGAATVARNKKK